MPLVPVAAAPTGGFRVLPRRVGSADALAEVGTGGGSVACVGSRRVGAGWAAKPLDGGDEGTAARFCEQACEVESITGS